MIQGIRYLDPLLDEMARRWPDNRLINIVCHGHSVPAGYFATPYVDPFHSYPHLLHRLVKERFPFAVSNVIVTAIGGETSLGGAQRFDSQVLCHRPDVLTIDYGLNDRRVSAEAPAAWSEMIRKAQDAGVYVILCTPTWDNSYYLQNDAWHALVHQAETIRELADRFSVGLSDSFAAFERSIREPADLALYLSHGNHPTQAGHQLVAQEISKYFIAR